MTTEKAGSVSAALARVLAQVHRVPKNGRNTFHQYDYTTESDLTDFLRPLLAAEGLSIVPSVDDVQRRTYKTKKDEDAVETLVKMSFRIRHAASNEELGPFPWYGESTDKGDKGLYKAITGAVKYFLFKLFLVSTGDDPEVDDDRAPTRKPAAPAPRPAATPETPRDEAPAPSAPGAPSAPSAPSALSCAERLKAYVDRHNKDWKSVGAAQRALGMDNERALKLPAEQLKTLVEYLEAQEATA